jgi:hypothetical protein
VAAGAGTQLLRSTESLRENKKIAFKILGEMEAIISIHNPKLEIIRKKFVRGDLVGINLSKYKEMCN